MASFVPTSDETVADQHRYTAERLTEISCETCAAKVLVKKNSEHHTSVQWTDDALQTCQEFRGRDTSLRKRDVHKPCARLMTSIDDAVKDGNILIGAYDGY